VIPGHKNVQVNTKAFFDEVDADKSGSISKVGSPMVALTRLQKFGMIVAGISRGV
jgi:hypothetical protein